MGRIARLLSFIRIEKNGAKLSDVKVDPGAQANITGEHFAPIGEDAHPLPNDYVVTNNIIGTGREVISGYVDPNNLSKAQPGDKRIYARNEAGAEVAEIWLKNVGSVTITAQNCIFEVNSDGSIKGNNGNGMFELSSSGDFLVNGVTIDTNGNINSPGTISAPSIQAAGKEQAGHVHFVAATPGNSGPNL